jgi:flagellar protein FliO/FliZ
MSSLRLRVLLIPALSCCLAIAATAQGLESATTIESIDISSILLSLAVVLGLIVAGAFVLKRAPFALAGRGTGPLKLLASLPLGPRERLLLVGMRGREVLVGVSPAGVSIAPVAHAADAHTDEVLAALTDPADLAQAFRGESTA